MKRIFYTLSLITLAINAKAQKFEEVQTNIPNFGYSVLNVTDFNGDNYKDLLICGDDDFFDTTCNIYKNNEGTFDYFQSLSNPLYMGDIKFANLRNDGTLDIVLTGQHRNDIVNYKSYQYQYNGSSYELVESHPFGKVYSSYGLGDFDNDGQLDVFLNGVDNSGHKEGKANGYYLEFQKNDKGELTSTNLLDGSQNGDFVLADFNNDGLLDLAIFGVDNEGGTDISHGAFFKIYLNENGTLKLSQTLDGMLYGSIISADYNADGFLDLVATGTDVYENPVTYYLQNDGNGEFTPNQLDQATVNYSMVKNIDTGDLNNDGYYDIIIAGEDTDANPSTYILIYNPETNEFDTVTEETGLGKFGPSVSLQLFDYNNDNLLDLIITSAFDENYEYKTALYKNLSTETNLKPTAPTTFSSEVTDDVVKFSWSNATDDKTPVKALQYELTVGSESGKSDIAKYTVTTDHWFLNKENLPETIYWSVKAIDASKVLSDASEEQIVANLGLDNATQRKISIYPNPTSDFININTNDKIKSIAITNLSGQKVIQASETTKVDVQHLPAGVYVLEVVNANNQKTQSKFIKK